MAVDVYDRASQLLGRITSNRSGVYDRMGEWLV